MGRIPKAFFIRIWQQAYGVQLNSPSLKLAVKVTRELCTTIDEMFVLEDHDYD